MKATTYRRMINLWPPFLCTGIALRHVSDDFRVMEVSLRQRPFNWTPSGAHFGGSLFAMTDPFYALMIARALGRGYTIWDQSASIQFRRPGIGTVTARFTIDETTIEAIRAAADNGQKVLQDFAVDVLDGKGMIVASVEKTVYIRKKREL